MSKYMNAKEVDKIFRDYISLDILEEKRVITAEGIISIGEALSRKFRSVDVIEIVRCKDCRHYILFNGRDMCKRRALYNDYFKEYYGLTATEKQNFCSYGERSESNEVL